MQFITLPATSILICRPQMYMYYKRAMTAQYLIVK